jgi:hypothetical protein
VRYTSSRGWNKRWRRLEGLGNGHLPIFHVPEINLPGNMYIGGIPFPLKIHLVYIVCGVAMQKGIVGILKHNFRLE